MSTTIFTPGPWKTGFYSPSRGGVEIEALDTEETNALVAIVFSDIRAKEEARANANLIAAAPELYAALEDIAAHLERIGDSRKDAPFIDAANAALAKARGES